MKVVILAGGTGTRIGEESHLRPKPMIEIGGKPILWHIMKIYSHSRLQRFHHLLRLQGLHDQGVFRQLFSPYVGHHHRPVNNQTEIHQSNSEPWRVTLVDTGESTMTGGRIKRIRHYLGDEDFCLTYGDGVSDVDVTKLIAFHRAQGVPATVTAIQPPGRFGCLEVNEERITTFQEKPLGDGGWISGGFFVLSPKVCDYIADDQTIWEREPLERLARGGNVAAYRHRGFWQCMDTMRDRVQLEEFWQSANPPWRVWK